MAFHRFAVPSYTGGLPGGYDYLNNAVSGTPAPADGALGAGPNTGSYFMGQSEQASSAAWNRAARALGENTDALDDLLRRDIVVAVREVDVVAGAPVPTITLVGAGIYLGHAGAGAGDYKQYFQVVDQNDNEIVTGTIGSFAGSEASVVSISGGTFGSGGFSTSDIILTLNVSIPTSTTYRVYYYRRNNLAVMPAGTLAGHRRVWSGSPALTPAVGGQYSLAANPLTWQFRELFQAVNASDRIRTITAGSTMHEAALRSRDGTIVLDPGAAFNLQLPSPTAFRGWRVLLISTAAMGPTTAVTLVRAGAEQINGSAANLVLNIPMMGWLITSDGTNWHVRALNRPGPFVTTRTSAFVLTRTERENYINVNTSGGAFALTFPNPATCLPDQFWTITDINGALATNAVTMTRFASESIGGVASNFVLDAAWGSWTFFTDQTNWFIR